MCTDSYCLRTADARPDNVDGDDARREQLNGEKLIGDKHCRFHYPKDPHPQPMIVLTWNPAYGVYDGPRNDPRMNRSNRTLSLRWLANTDISPCTPGKDFSPKLTYVAVSRVRNLDGIMFDCLFDLQDITTPPNADRLADLERRKKDQDVMNLAMRTGMSEEVMNSGIDNDEEHGDASSEDIYGDA
ncbi:hypothetical protein E4U59_005280 [Claviceps monticola]|nr:hypothetical protein E4U59_005280 [Claviceps monticola]